MPGRGRGGERVRETLDSRDLTVCVGVRAIEYVRVRK